MQHAKWIAHRLYRGLGPHRNSSADFIPPQDPTPFARHPGKGKQRGALRRFDRMFGSQASTAGSAVSPGSQVDSTPASQFPPVSPQYSPASPSQPASVSLPQEEQGAKFFCVIPRDAMGASLSIFCFPILLFLSVLYFLSLLVVF